MSEFSLLHGSILNSSVWVLGSKEERLVWITILAMKDREGVVKSSMVGLADRAKVTLKECSAAVEKFLEPDLHDTSKVEQGRRLKVLPGGWKVVNHEYYRYSSEERREAWRLNKAKQRARAAKDEGGGPLPGEMIHRNASPEMQEDMEAKDADRMSAIAEGKR